MWGFGFLGFGVQGLRLFCWRLKGLRVSGDAVASGIFHRRDLLP